MYRLRELSSKDLTQINEWRNDSELITMLSCPFRFINLSVDEEWYKNYLANRSNTVRCTIVDDGDNILGLISLCSIDYINQRAELHIMIGNMENYGKGIGSFAVKKILEHAFYNLNLQRVEIGVLDYNLRAIKLYEKCGFVKEGVKRDAVFKSGRYVDLLQYGILRKEYIK